MFFSVIVGYVLAAMYAFAGVMKIISYVKSVNRELGYESFINGLAQSCDYLGVAVILVLLIQIACFLERLVIEARKEQLSCLPMQPTPVPYTSARKPAPHAHESHMPVAPQPISPPEAISPASSYTGAFSESANASGDPEAPRVPAIPGETIPGNSHVDQRTEEQNGLNYFRMKGQN